MVAPEARDGGLDDIRHVIIRNVRGYCRGGHHIVRLLNTPGADLYDVVLDGLVDTSPPTLRCKAAVKIGDRNYGGGVAPLGTTRRILIHNVITRAQHGVLIGGSLCDSIISNVIRHGSPGEAVTVASGPQFIRDVTITNARLAPARLTPGAVGPASRPSTRPAGNEPAMEPGAAAGGPAAAGARWMNRHLAGFDEQYDRYVKSWSAGQAAGKEIAYAGKSTDELARIVVETGSAADVWEPLNAFLLKTKDKPEARKAQRRAC